ncbi:fatty acyl-CoA hydrolase precursor, medium chain [Lingula anatina]|uniref:Fatty acyl-CoA hydrolase precursor, medium chain n=1 Tax=Lingula anatina TaxID=7574 RepID=A0A1S3K6J3_LINAN|nr:fatty acyl-CoA hydrolase precursor, medium chain [Lingula anatina]|eukprot:XP_013418255.1 fatty acyl-CoA hydrolase precursor, medium chain [Lingula anatina]
MESRVSRLSLLVVLVNALAKVDAQTTVTINTGTIQGFSSTVDGIRVNTFLGIPFAKPPVGDLRFAKPQPPASWTGVKQTVKYGPSCMQRPNEFGFPNATQVSEDCLTLNVFAPNTTGVKAVMVFIHGGGYYFGGTFHYDYTEFAARGNIIVVTVNYRLGAFGFLSIDGANAPGNLGLWDQIEGLKWVKANIKIFNGDPQRVTIFGESAGGGSVTQLALTAAARGLFQRFIPHSGSAWADWAWSTRSPELSMKIGKIVGCNVGPAERAELLACLRKTDAEAYLNASFEATVGVPGLLFYCPEVDGDMFPKSLSDVFKNADSDVVRHFRSLDYMGGFNDGDGAILTPPTATNGMSPADLRDKWIPLKAKDISPEHEAKIAEVLTEEYYDSSADAITTARRYADILTDWLFTGAMGSATAAHASPTGGSTYLYYFTKVPSFGYVVSPMPPWFRRSNHADDLSFLMGAHHPTMVPNATFTDEEKEFSKKMMTYWANFAKTGNPNQPVSPSTTWPEYTASGKEYIELGDVISAKSDVIPKRMVLWTNTIPKIRASAFSTAACGNFPHVFGIAFAVLCALIKYLAYM